MPRNRTMKLMEECNGSSGEDPEYGAIFMSSSSTRKECLRRQLFGLPSSQAKFVKQVKAGMILFLFEFEKRELHGVFQARSDGAINIEPNAFCSSGKHFPAQVKFYEKWHCRPLRESEFCHAIKENYFTQQKFNFGLSKAQVKELLSLFSLKKVRSSRLRKTVVGKPTRQCETNFRNTADDRRLGGHPAGEGNGDVELEFPARVTASRDTVGNRLTTNYGLGDDFDIDQDYNTTKRDKYYGAFGVCTRHVDPQMHGLKDRVADDFRMNNSYGTNALITYSDYSLINDGRVPKNLRHTTNGWAENEYHEKDGIAQGRSWSNHKNSLNFESDPVVPQSSVHLESPYGTNTGYYDPCEPGIMGDTSSRHDLGAPNVDSMGSASFPDNSIGPGGGYVSDKLPSERVQLFADEHNGKSMNETSSLDMDYYIPMPTEHSAYQTNTGMIGVGCFESETGSGHLRHPQFPDLLTSAGATENMRNFERPSYSRDNIFSSFAYPLSTRDSSPKDGVYQHQEELEGHVSYSNDTLVGDSRIYPSFTYPSTAVDRAYLHPENRIQNNVGAYQQHEEFGVDAFDSNNRVIGIKDGVNPERKRARKSVFTRLALPPKERDAEKDTSPDTESVDELMAFLNDYHRHWMEQKRPNRHTHEDFGKPKKRKEKTHTREVLDSELMLPCTETTPDDLLDCEEDSAQTQPFIDFKRRSKAQKSLGNPTHGCNDSAEHSAPQKKRRLLRPKLTEDDSEKDPIENVLASQAAAGEVPPGRGDQ